MNGFALRYFFLRGSGQMSWQVKIEGLSCPASLAGILCVKPGQAYKYEWRVIVLWEIWGKAVTSESLVK